MLTWQNVTAAIALVAASIIVWLWHHNWTVALAPFGGWLLAVVLRRGLPRWSD